MPCSICREIGHNAPTCTDPRLQTMIQMLNHLFYESVVKPRDYYLAYNLLPPNYFYNRTSKNIREVTVGCHVSAWKHVYPKFLESLRLDDRPLYSHVRRWLRLITDERLVHPRTHTDYRNSIISIVRYVSDKMLNTQIQLHNSENDILTMPIEVPPPNVVDMTTPPALPNNDILPPPLPRSRLRRPRYTDVNSTNKPTILFRMDNPDTLYIYDDVCAVCMEPNNDNNVVALTCNHAYCANCTGEFIKRCNGKCPSCRDLIKEVRFKPTILPEHFNKMISIMNG